MSARRIGVGDIPQIVGVTLLPRRRLRKGAAVDFAQADPAVLDQMRVMRKMPC